ncbi:MAG: DUF1549 domain-containing protein, partial [Bryobacteraceae bacterium]
SRLETAKLQPAPEANRSTLIRRVSLDLTGLPPTPAEVAVFLNDSSPDAYEKVVDRLLASERYGEHRARYWLDAARYADTHGIHIDNYREMWPYRDWVIQAFNRNMPFDRFTVEQIAGDLLPNRTANQQIASGFHRCNMTTNEGGSIPEEIEVVYAKDRVDTTATVWLGLTAGCASCHDHKFDPISQKDFYAFAAFFRNVTQRAMDGNIPDTPPILVVPKDEDTARWNHLRGEVARLDGERKNLRTAAQARFDSWLAETARPMPSKPLDAASEYLVVNAGTASLPPGVTLGKGPNSDLQALHFGEKAVLEVPRVEFEADRPFTIAAWIYLPAGEDNFIVASQSQALKGAKIEPDEEDTKTRGWTLEITGRVPTLKLSATGGGSIQVRPSNVQRLKPGVWSHVTYTYDGSRDQGGLALYVNGKVTTNEGKGDSTELKGSIKTEVPLRLGGSRSKFFPEGAIADFRVYKRALQADEAEILHRWTVIQNAFAKGAGTLTGTEREAIFVYYLNHFDTDYRKMAGNLDVVDSERRSIRRRAAVTHVMQEKSDAMPMANILFRGQYDQPRDEVQANVPAVLPPLASSTPRNRLGLAEWLVRADNPLPARVTVNRFWQEFFGMGLVKSAEDFGSQGEAPSHPELLDWMAVEFRESGWDVKKLLRLMVTSATYRQAAISTPQKLQADPENRLLARGPRFRMDAEMVRDLTLFASGIMNLAVGGPSVKPYQPGGLWETVAMKGSNTRYYKQDHGEKLYRRSMYTFWKR